MADVFISYARETELAARRIAEKLRALGYSVWFDDEIPAHRAYAQVISEQLEQAKAVVVVWSEAASTSHWVRSEASRALDKGTLVQANVDGSRLPMPFDQIQCVDLSRWKGNSIAPAWRKIADSVSELIGKQDGHDSAGLGDARRQRLQIDRRALVIGAGGAAFLAAAGALVWWPRGSEEPPAEAEVLLQKSLAVMQDGRPDEHEQAIAYLVEATRIAPGYARAWGTLAFAYANRKFQVPLPARAGHDTRCRSAARTALELDREEPIALCALAMLQPPYRNWLSAQQQGLSLARRFTEYPVAVHMLADTLTDVGRWRDSLEWYRKINRTTYFIPLSDRSIILALWSSGDLQAAEAMLAEAAQRWPQHYAIWDLRLQFLTHSGRADEAVRLLDNESIRPVGYSDDLRRTALLTARAIAGSADRDEAIRENLFSLERGPVDVLTYLNRKIALAHVVAQRCAALGERDSAFALLDGYFRGRGEWARLAPVAGDADRSTISLFEPPMAPLWKDGRFSELVADIGLEAYWRQTRTVPDFRQA